MSLIVAQGLCKSWSDTDVLKNVSVTLAPRRRVGLVGPNGGGKTTLIRILAGLEPATEGTIQRKTGLRIGYLPQDPPALSGSSLHQAMLDVFTDLHRIEQQMHAVAANMEQRSDPKELARYGELVHEFEVRGGYAYARKIERVLTGLGFPRDVWDRPLEQLSGGQRTRAFLGRLLLQDPDVLLLDEPTNHLDFQTVEWLETYLQVLSAAVVVVSHDRYLLDRVTSTTWEIASAALESYKGNYSAYLTQRHERFAERLRQWADQQQYIRETEDFIRRFGAGQRSREARGRRTRLERFLKTEAVARPIEHGRINVRFHVTERAGEFVVRLSDLQVGYAGHPALADVEKLEIQRGRRVAIVGPNGCGKTTLVRTILGELPPLAGTLRLGTNVRIGYLSQTHAELDGRMRAVDAVRQADPAVTEHRARTLLGGLMLSEDEALKTVDQLSGGQRSRVLLARLMVLKANVLVMDEPTNHLDIASQEVLQQVLTDFDGTVIFVSHDRYLIQALATDIWAMHGGTVTALHGDWDRYLRWRDGQSPGDSASTAAARTDGRQRHQARRKEKAAARKQANDRRKAQRRFEQVEAEIHTLEAELKSLSEEISTASADGDTDRVTDLAGHCAAGDARLRELYDQWDELATVVEGN